MNVDTSALELEVINDLTIELSAEPTFDASLLAIKVKLAVRDIMARRNYNATTFTEEKILDDLNSYYSVICNVARFDYNQIGAEGEASHSENGVSRTYVDRDSLMKSVHAFVNVF